MNILMVCLGNICRSPLAAGILKHKVSQHQLPWTVDSAGTAGYHAGSLPDERSIEIAAKHGLDITDQRARKVRSIDFEVFDLIFAMDSLNYGELMHQAHEHEKHKIKLILNELYPNQNRAVPDPYFGGQDGFQNVYSMLDAACDQIIARYGHVPKK